MVKKKGGEGSFARLTAGPDRNDETIRVNKSNRRWILHLVVIATVFLRKIKNEEKNKIIVKHNIN